MMKLILIIKQRSNTMLGNVGVSMDLIFKMCEVFGIKPRELFDFRD